MPRNSPNATVLPRREDDVLRAVEELLLERLPDGWTVDLELAPSVGNAVADGQIAITSPAGEQAVLFAEAKVSFPPREVRELVRRANRLMVDGDGSPAERTAPLLAARFLSPRVRDLLIKSETNYADATGNLRISIPRPGLFIEAQGASRNPVPEKRATQSLRGPAAARIIRTLWEARPPVGIRELADASGLAPGTVSKIVDLLRREDIVDPERGAVESVDRAALLERWAEDYSFSGQNSTALFLEPRSLDALLEKLKKARFGYAVTGSLAARLVDEYAEAKLAMIYVEDVQDAARELRLTAVPSGGNVLLAEPFDPIAFDNLWERDGLRYANLAQVVADLLGSPGRGPEEGEQLLRTLTATTRA